VRADGTGRVLEAGTAAAEHAITLLAERYPQQRAVGAVRPSTSRAGADGARVDRPASATAARAE